MFETRVPRLLRFSPQDHPRNKTKADEGGGPSENRFELRARGLSRPMHAFTQEGYLVLRGALEWVARKSVLGNRLMGGYRLHREGQRL